MNNTTATKQPSNANPTTYQRRYLIFCDVTGRDPGSFPVREYVQWVTQRLRDFKAAMGWGRWYRLDDQDHSAFDEFLKQENEEENNQ